MKLHVLPGDSLVEEFEKTDIDGEVVVCRECLIVGDVDADILPEFWDRRARFMLAEYGGDGIEYHEHVADEFAKLLDLPTETEVNLWFEYELFCQVNMWFCLWLMQDSDAAVYRVTPVVRTAEDVWKGFAKLGAAELQKCYDARIQFTANDISFGTNLWDAYRKGDHTRLRELSLTDSKCFTHLREVCEAEIERSTKPKQILDEITAEGITEFAQVFEEFSRRAGVYGFGDAQLKRIMKHA